MGQIVHYVNKKNAHIGNARAGGGLPVRLSAPKRGQGQTIFRKTTLGRPCCSDTKIEFFIGGCIAREQIALQRILKLLSDMLGTFLPC